MSDPIRDFNAGNQADLEAFDYARYMLEDPTTNVIAMSIEGFKNSYKPTLRTYTRSFKFQYYDPRPRYQ